MADDLQFRDFGTGSHVIDIKEDKRGNETTYHFQHDENGDGVDPSQRESQPQQTWNFFSLKFYQQYFDVETSEVVNRLVYSMVPRPGSSFILHNLRPKPDLYGPVWVCLTLIFAVGITGNLSSYVTSAGRSSDFHGAYDFGVVTASAGTIVTYVTLVPVLLYSFIRYKGSDVPFDLVDILSCYGYSLTAYLFAVILWVFPVDWLQWTVLGITSFLSSMVLLFTFWSNLGNLPKPLKLLTVGLMVACHVGVAVVVKVFFFHHHESLTALTTTAVQLVTTHMGGNGTKNIL